MSRSSVDLIEHDIVRDSVLIQCLDDSRFPGHVSDVVSMNADDWSCRCADQYTSLRESIRTDVIHRQRIE